MSSAAAIAAVTATLRNMLALHIGPEPDLGDTIFTVQPPDQARPPNATANQLNLFLYKMSTNPAWSNTDQQDRLRRGESGPPPLALNLSFLLTAYGRDNDVQRPFSLLLMGHAMRLLHDMPVLDPEDIRAAIPHGSQDMMIERVRLTLNSLTLDEITKLWTGLQTQYRLSASYEASVVLIDSRLPTRAPLPVLRRGRDDDGIVAQADMQSPFPILATSQLLDTAQLGDRIQIIGNRLGGDNAVVRLAQGARIVEISPEPVHSDQAIAFTIPQAATIRAGVHALSVAVTQAGHRRSSNEIPFAIAPRITTKLPLSVARGHSTIDLACSPPVDPTQRVRLYLGDREVQATPFDRPTSNLRFVVDSMQAGDYVLRLRVDGIDSKFIVDTNARPAEFDPRAKLKIVP